jgi:hypothetical protein
VGPIGVKALHSLILRTPHVTSYALGLQPFPSQQRGWRLLRLEAHIYMAVEAGAEIASPSCVSCNNLGLAVSQPNRREMRP